MAGMDRAGTEDHRRLHPASNLRKKLANASMGANFIRPSGGRAATCRSSRMRSRSAFPPSLITSLRSRVRLSASPNLTPPQKWRGFLFLGILTATSCPPPERATGCLHRRRGLNDPFSHWPDARVSGLLLHVLHGHCRGSSPTSSCIPRDGPPYEFH